MAEPCQRVRHPGQPVVEAEAHALRRFGGARDEPFLVFRHAHAGRLGQRVQHAGRAVRETETAAREAELVDIAGEEAVRAVRGRARPDRAHHVRRQPVPARAAASVAWRRRRPPLRGAAVGLVASAAGRMVVAGNFPHRLVKKPLRDREQPGDHHRELRRLVTVQREQRRQRHEHRQSQAREAVGVDIEPGPVAGRGEPGVADRADPSLADVARGLEVDEGHGVVRPHDDVEHVQVVEDHAALMHGRGGALDLAAYPECPFRVRFRLRRVRHTSAERVTLGEE